MLTTRAFAEIGLKLLSIYLLVQAISRSVPLASMGLSGQIPAGLDIALVLPTTYGILAIALYFVSATWAQAMARKIESPATAEKEVKTDIVGAGLVCVGVYLGVMACVAIFSSTLQHLLFGVGFLAENLLIFGIQLVFSVCLIVGFQKISQAINSLRPLR